MKTLIAILLFSTSFCNAAEKNLQSIAKAIVAGLQNKDNKNFRERSELEIGALKMVTAEVTIEGVNYYLTWSKVFDETPVLTIVSQGSTLKDTGITGETKDPTLNQAYKIALSKISECMREYPKEMKKALVKNP